MTLEARNVFVWRAGRQVLRDVALQVAPGEVLALIGPNAAGKSTLLKVLSGAGRTETGTVAMDGTVLDRWPRSALARRRAVLPQAPTLAFPFRVLEVVLLGRSPHAGRSSRDRDRRIAAAALTEAGAMQLAERPYNQLSGGERQRVQLARVLAQVWRDGEDGGARYVLLDEPTNNLDPSHQRAVMETVRRFADGGNGVLAILHDPNLASLYADRIAVLADGRVVACGAPQAVIERSLMEAVFRMPVSVLTHPERNRPLLVPA